MIISELITLVNLNWNIVLTLRKCMPDAACPGKQKMLYAWETGDPPSEIPDDVGFKVGDDFPYIVLQVHYAHEMEMRKSYPFHTSVKISFTDYR